MFRFTIRDVLWLTVVVALSVVWWLHAVKLGEVQRQNTSLRKTINGVKSFLKDEFLVDFQEREGGGFSISRSDELPARLTGPRRIVGSMPVNPIPNPPILKASLDEN